MAASYANQQNFDRGGVMSSRHTSHEGKNHQWVGQPKQHMYPPFSLQPHPNNIGGNKSWKRGGVAQPNGYLLPQSNNIPPYPKHLVSTTTTPRLRPQAPSFIGSSHRNNSNGQNQGGNGTSKPDYMLNNGGNKLPGKKRNMNHSPHGGYHKHRPYYQSHRPSNNHNDWSHKHRGQNGAVGGGPSSRQNQPNNGQPGNSGPPPGLPNHNHGGHQFGKPDFFYCTWPQNNGPSKATTYAPGYHGSSSREEAAKWAKGSTNQQNPNGSYGSGPGAANGSGQASGSSSGSTGSSTSGNPGGGGPQGTGPNSGPNSGNGVPQTGPNGKPNLSSSSSGSCSSSKDGFRSAGSNGTGAWNGNGNVLNLENGVHNMRISQGPSGHHSRASNVHHNGRGRGWRGGRGWNSANKRRHGNGSKNFGGPRRMHHNGPPRLHNRNSDDSSSGYQGSLYYQNSERNGYNNHNEYMVEQTDEEKRIREDRLRQDLKDIFGIDKYPHNASLHLLKDDDGLGYISSKDLFTIPPFPQRQKDYGHHFERLFWDTVRSLEPNMLNLKFGRAGFGPKIGWHDFIVYKFLKDLKSAFIPLFSDDNWEEQHEVHKLIGSDNWVAVDKLVGLEPLKKLGEPKFIKRALRVGFKFKHTKHAEFNQDYTRVKRRWTHSKTLKEFKIAVEDLWKSGPYKNKNSNCWVPIKAVVEQPEIQKLKEKWIFEIGERGPHTVEEIIRKSIRFSFAVELDNKEFPQEEASLLDFSHRRQYARIRKRPEKSTQKPKVRKLLNSNKKTPAKDHTNEPGMFSVFTYNILADFLSNDTTFPWCDAATRDWEKRLPLLLQQIKLSASDVLCLQEVQGDHWERHPSSNRRMSPSRTSDSTPTSSPEPSSYLKDQLSKMGYDSVYKKNTPQPNRARAMNFDIGIVIAWKRERWRKIKNEHVDLCKVGDICRNKTMKKKLGCPHVAMMALLEEIESGRRFIVATTHLSAQWMRPYIPLMQMMWFLKCLNTFHKANGSPPVIICGDFNSTSKSSVVELVLNNEINMAHPDLNDVKTDEGLAEVLQPNKARKHEFDLVSAYEECLGEEPPFTNFVKATNWNPNDFNETIDYIFVDKELNVVSVLEPLDRNDVQVEFALPNSFHPSDHIPLQTVLTF